MNPKRVWAASALTFAAVALILMCASSTVRGYVWSGFRSSPEQPARTMDVAFSSSSFPNGGSIPAKYTCDGADLSPQFSWTEPPAGTRSLALMANDPDALIGTFTHWVVFNLPPAAGSLPEGIGPIDQLPAGGRQGRNDFDKIGYGGPCPPGGKPHRYFFRLYALDSKLDLEPGANGHELEQAMQGHVLGESDWMGKYGR